MEGYPAPDLSKVRLHQMISKLTCDVEEVPHSRQTGNNSLHCAVLGSDIDTCFQELNAVDVNDVNLKGETALHLAAKNKSIASVILIEILIAAGADVNARNKWGQTPLHYAAIVDSLKNLQCLVRVPNIDVNAKDVNGYNALHCYIGSNVGNNLDSSEELNHEQDQVSSELQKAIHTLVEAGTEINSQTTYGHSILHLASTRDDNSPLLKYILLNFKEINLNLKNLMGENFLHVYVGSEIFEEIMVLFDVIAKSNLSILKELLSDQNALGRTPWNIMIDDVNASKQAVEEILTYGVSVSRADNLGNTVLHRIAGVSSGIVCCDILEVLIKGGADTNAQNIYGESAASVLFLEAVFDVFLKFNMNFNMQDRWGRSPLVSIMKHRPIPDLLRKVIDKGKADINTRDVYGSTPLHFAAYNNYPEQVEILLEYGADKDATDNLHDRPLDTVKRHCSFRCNHILQKAEKNDVNVLYTRNKTFEEMLLDLPKTITSSKMKTAHDVQKLLGLPDNLSGFMDHLMTAYFTRSPKHAKEVEAVVSEINCLVKAICTQIAGYDSRFEMSVFPTGSSVEGTKVGRPDEFDFVLCLDKLNDITEIVMTKDCLETGYACLKFTDNPVKDEYLPFSDSDGYFLAFPFLQYFFRYLTKALNETHLWRSGNLYYNFEDKMEVIRGKPVFNFSAYWVGLIYKQLKISIDLVPAVYKRGWWPPNININTIPLMNEAINAAGCFLMLQTQTHDFDRKRHTMNDSVNQTCNSDADGHNFLQKRKLRISATPAEICLVRSLPRQFKHAYALAKIVKSKEVCPEIEIDKLPTKLYTRLSKFESSKTLPIKPTGIIKSYMLKNCMFYVFQEMQLDFHGDQELESSQIIGKVYEYLLTFADERYLNPYFLPYSDVFEFEKDMQRSSYNDFMFRLKRELSVKLILGILNQPYSDMCLASKNERIDFT